MKEDIFTGRKLCFPEGKWVTGYSSGYGPLNYILSKTSLHPLLPGKEQTFTIGEAYPFMPSVLPHFLNCPQNGLLNWKVFVHIWYLPLVVNPFSLHSPAFHRFLGSFPSIFEIKQYGILFLSTIPTSPYEYKLKFRSSMSILLSGNKMKQNTVTHLGLSSCTVDTNPPEQTLKVLLQLEQ